MEATPASASNVIAGVNNDGITAISTSAEGAATLNGVKGSNNSAGGVDKEKGKDGSKIGDGGGKGEGMNKLDANDKTLKEGNADNNKGKKE